MLPRRAGTDSDAVVSLDAGATSVLTVMTPGDREAVLNDAMDGVIGRISMPSPLGLR